MIFGISYPVAWLIAAVALFIIEIMGGTVALLCLCIGCLGGSLTALLGGGYPLQIAVTAIVTIAVFFAGGPAIRRFYRNHRSTRHYASNMDALIGRKGIVTHEVTADFMSGGRVRVDGDNWQAFTSPENAPLRRGSSVVVESYDSIVIRVRPAD